MEEARTCTRCQETKPVTDFAKEKRSRGGRRNQCKACRVRANLDRLTPEDRRARAKVYFNTPAGKAARARGNKKWRQGEKGKAYNQRPDVLEAHRQKSARYRQRETLKVAARTAIRCAKSRGDIRPAREYACAYCGRRAHDYHHHNGYEPEHHLDVVALCKDCHHKAEQ